MAVPEKSLARPCAASLAVLTSTIADDCVVFASEISVARYIASAVIGRYDTDSALVLEFLQQRQ